MSTDTTAHAAVEIGSSRSFGTVFAVVFAVIALYPLAFGDSARLWALAIAAAFLVATLTRPQVLQPLNLVWFKFGMLLASVVNPIVMCVIYVLTILPAGIIVRLLRKDLLRVQLDETAATYWISRSPPGPEPESLKEQF